MVNIQNYYILTEFYWFQVDFFWIIIRIHKESLEYFYNSEQKIKNIIYNNLRVKTSENIKTNGINSQNKFFLD